MVMISSTKYACETCIKGHRSSTCKHTDRPLFEIKKKGRPVTQCEHCRELRKTKQVHVKCVCEVHDDAHPKASSCSKKKASSKVPENAAFPHGLPQGLEASIAMQSPSEGSPSETEHCSTCSCKTGGACNCFTPRKSAPRRRRKTISDLRPEFDVSSDNPSRPWNTNLPMASMSSTSLTHVLARIAELRPVLPKPPGSGPCHDPSSGIAHSHPDRHHSHENMFSPYGRAYEYTHGSQHGHETGNHPDQPIDTTNANMLLKEESYTDQSNLLQFWNPTTGIATFPSACGCGDGCSCPGCAQHADASVGAYTSGNAFNTCTNPGICNACVDNAVLSLPNSFLESAVSNYDSQPSQIVDDWLRQVSDMPPPLSSTSDYENQVDLEPGFVQPTWETYQLPDNPEIQQVPDVLPVDGVVPCICPPDECMCDSSKGEDCSQLVASAGMAFAVLSKRMACQAGGPVDASSALAGEKENLLVPNVHSLPNDYLHTPQLRRSRSSSSSSMSGHNLDQFFSRRSSYDASGLQISSLEYFSNDLSVASQPDFSPTQGDHDGLAILALSDISAPSSDGSLEDYYTQYDPTLGECTS